MGTADVVPGVSGGTIAFITGILDTLLDSIRAIRPSLLKMIKEQGFKAAFLHINGPFLVSLFSGILCAIFTLAKIISWLLVNMPIPIWSFFFGLILVSIWHILRQLKHRPWWSWVAMLIGVLFAYTITVLSPLSLEPNMLNFVFAGAIAICAMILPGISGSFILLLLGMYAPVLGAAKEFNIPLLILFALGAVIGLLSFSHILSWLLRRFRESTLMFLVGLMMGTLPKIWPWKQTISWRTNSKGELVPLLEQNLTPQQFELISGNDAQMLLAILMMSIAIFLVLGLEKWGQSHE